MICRRLVKILAFTVLCMPVLSYGDSYQLNTIEYPGAMGTFMDGLNNSGQLAGSFNPPDSRNSYAFVWTKGAFDLVNAPGSVSSNAIAINNSGQVLVSYFPQQGGYFGTYLKTGISFVSIVHPGATETDGAAINDKDQIVGTYSNAKIFQQAFVYTNGAFTDINVPFGTETQPTGINNQGQIIGNYTRWVGTNGYENGFVDTGGKFTTINFPGAYATDPTGINDQGQIVGYYQLRMESPNVPFLYSKGTYMSLDEIGSYSEVWDINDLGQLVGTGAGHDNFLATPIVSSKPEPSCFRLVLIVMVPLTALFARFRSTASSIKATPVLASRLDLFSSEVEGYPADRK